jgi:hypothetical protein
MLYIRNCQVKTSEIASHYLQRLHLKYNSILSLNKNLLISGLVGLVFSLSVAYLLDSFSTGIFLNSTTTVVCGFISYKILFSVLFYRDNKRNMKNTSEKVNFRVLRQVFIRMIFASSIFDVINNASRFSLLLYLLKLDYPPIQSAVISSIIASVLSYVVMNVIVRYVHLFSYRN